MLRCRCDSGFEDNEFDEVFYGVYIYLYVRPSRNRMRITEYVAGGMVF